MQDLVPHELLAKFAPEVQQVLIQDIADAARAHWVRLAQSELKSTGADYSAGIQGVQSSPGMAWVTLTGEWPNMIENGYASFDMRTTLLQEGAPGVQENADGGLYRSIFMRRGMGAQGTGRNFTNVTDLYAQALGAKRAKAMGKKAMADVRARTATTSAPGGPTRWGGRLPPGSGGMPALRKGELSPAGHPLTADHKTDLMDGAYYFQKKYAKATQGYVGVFRTISTSSPDGWIHPGHAPAGLAVKVADYMGRLAPQMMAALGSELPDV